MNNPYAMPYACEKCRDVRTMTRSVRAREADLVACDKCGLLNDEEYERFRTDAWARQQEPPEICELDLTPEEFKTHAAFREQFPRVSKLTLLSWMEGQRYNPAEDVEFLEDARAKFKAWRAR